MDNLTWGLIGAVLVMIAVDVIKDIHKRGGVFDLWVFIGWWVIVLLVVALILALRKL